MAQSEWIKRLTKITRELSELRLDARDVGDKNNDSDLLTAARKLTIAESALTDARSAFLKVKV